jgi:hypothetical protein
MTTLLILADHVHAGFAAAFRALHPAATIVDFDLAQIAANDHIRGRAHAALATADHIITYDAPAAFGPLATAALRAARRPLHLLPPFRFAGFHPDAIQILLDGARVAGPTGATHSRLAAAAYLAGLAVDDTLDLYNSLVFSRLGYFAAFQRERARLLRDFAGYGYDLDPLFRAWHTSGCFMLDAAHPRMRVLLDLARLLCGRCGLAPGDSVIAEYDVPNPLAAIPTHPLLPEIAVRIGVSPEGTFRGAARLGAKPTLYSLEAFVRASFDAYRRVPLATLRAADGVSAALAALNLREADFGRTAAAGRAAAAAPEDALFLTWHGMLLGTETATSMLVQAPCWPAAADSTPAAARIALPVTAPIATTLAGGSTIAPGPSPGSVTINRNGAFLTAPPRQLAARFAAAAAGPDECLLPIRRADLAVLRDLAAGVWRVEADGTLVTGAAMRLRTGFTLALGRYRIDLATARWQRIDGGVAAITPDATITFVPDADRVAGREIALDGRAPFAALPEAASIEQFRAAPGHRLHVQGAPEMTHLPLAVDNADRVWLQAAHYDGSAPRLGRHPYHATPTRAADKFILLSRGAEGVIADARGIWTRVGVLGGATLPAGMRAEGEALLLSQAAADAAEKITEPVCVFYNPNMQNWYHFLAESVVALHVLAPVLPHGTGLLLPPDLPALKRATGVDHMSLLHALGFAGMTLVHATGALVHAADVTWLENDHIGIMPAALLQSFRTRAHALRPPSSTRRRVYIKRRHLRRVVNNIMVETFLTEAGFEPVYPEEMSPSAQIDLFASADFVVAPHGAALASLLFCQPGTRVLELSPDTEFRPFFWHISEKLALIHAVLPCRTTNQGFNGHLHVNPDRFRKLYKMLTALEP